MVSLPGKKSFVPFVHELITWLAGAGRINLNTEASWSPSIYLPGSGGLKGSYFVGSKPSKTAQLIRLDSSIDFDWREGSPTPRFPKDRFVIQWSGRLLPPASGEFTLSAEADDSLELRIDGKTILTAKEGKRASATVNLEEGKAVKIEMTYRENWGQAYARLFWTPPEGTRSLIPSSALIPPVEKRW